MASLRRVARTSPATGGAVAQLGERLNGIQEVDGSIPFSSTNQISDLRRSEMVVRLGPDWTSNKGRSECQPQPDEADGYTHRRYLLASILHPLEAHAGRFL